MVTKRNSRPCWQVYELDEKGNILCMREWYRLDWAQGDAEAVAFQWRKLKREVYLVHPDGKQERVEIHTKWTKVE